MKYYVITEKIDLSEWDGKEPVLFNQVSHDMVIFKSGGALLDYEVDENGNPFEGPLVCTLDDEDQTGVLPDFVLSPGLIAKRSFIKVLKDCGVNNLETYPVLVHDEINQKTHSEYELVNILGCVPCANMQASEAKVIDDDKSVPSMVIIDKLVLNESSLQGYDLFHVQEDTDCIVLSEKLVYAIKKSGFNKIIFDEVVIV